MKHKYYKPNCKVEIITDLKLQYIEAIEKGFRPVVIGLNKDLKNLRMGTITLGDTIEDYAKNLYEVLKKAEKEYSYILIYKVKSDGLGKSIMKRIEKIIV